MTPRLLTLPEVAVRLQVSVTTVHRRIGAGELGWINIAPHGQRPRRRVSEAALDAYLQAHTWKSRESRPSCTAQVVALSTYTSRRRRAA